MVPDRVSQTADDARQEGGVLEEEHSYIENKNGKSTESVVQGNVYWLSAKILNGGVDGLLLCAMDDVEVRALEDRAERSGPSTSSSSTQPMHIREELTHAGTHGPGNPSAAERVDSATRLPFWSWCVHCVAGKIPLLPRKRRSSDRDLPDAQMDIFMNRKWDGELMTVLNFLDRGSGCTFACAVDQGPGDFLVSVIFKRLEFCGRKRIVLRKHAISALTTAVCQARADETVREALGGRTDQDDKRTTGAGAKDRGQHHSSCRSTDRSTRFLFAESTESTSTVLGHTAPWKKGHTEEKWSNLVSRSDAEEGRRALTSWNRAKRRGRTKTWQTPTECTWKDPYNVDLCSIVGARRRSKNWLVPLWEMMPEKTKLMEPRFTRRYITWALLQKHSPYLGMQVVSRMAWRTLGCVQIEVRAHLGGRRVDRSRHWQ